ncbi:MAG: KH domain-containing protein [Desulfurivibrio sp.]|nr:KH domain-containing protein [Desulfurivibrio sp.]
MMRDLVAFIAGSLVDRPEAVEVAATEQEDTLLLELTVAQEDLGKVIGRQGRTAKAMRTLLNAVNRESGHQVKLEIA